MIVAVAPGKPWARYPYPPLAPEKPALHVQAVEIELCTGESEFDGHDAQVATSLRSMMTNISPHIFILAAAKFPIDDPQLRERMVELKPEGGT